MPDQVEPYLEPYLSMPESDLGTPNYVMSHGLSEDLHKYIVILKLLRKVNKHTMQHNLTLCELGCGYGGLSRTLPDCMKYIGVDMRRDVVALATRDNPELPFIQADATTPLLAKSFPKAFDVTVCDGILDTHDPSNLATESLLAIRRTLSAITKHAILITYRPKGSGVYGPGTYNWSQAAISTWISADMGLLVHSTEVAVIPNRAISCMLVLISDPVRLKS